MHKHLLESTEAEQQDKDGLTKEKKREQVGIRAPVSIRPVE